MRWRKKDDTLVEINELLEIGNMTGQSKYSSLKKWFIIVMLSITTILIILLGGAYIYIHSSINKMNLVPTTSAYSDASINDTETEVSNIRYDNETLFDDINMELPDSPENEILSLDAVINKNIEKESSSIKSSKKVQNILIIGTDAREKGDRGRSDVMILVSINKSTKKIIATSLLRDIYLQIPNRKNNRINAAYAFGGAELLMDTVEENFKINVDKYVLVDFYSFIDVVDSVGGITLEVSDRDIPVINGYIEELNRLTGQELNKDFLMDPGTFLLNGKQALGYSRNRYVGNGDFSRTEKQRRVLDKVFQKVKKLNVIELNDFKDIILPQITTNLTEKEILSLIVSLPSLISYDVEQWSIPSENSYKSLRVNGMAVLGIDFDANINKLNQKVYE